MKIIIVYRFIGDPYFMLSTFKIFLFDSPIELINPTQQDK